MTLAQVPVTAHDYEDTKRMFSWWVRYLVRSDAYLAMCKKEPKNWLGPIARTFADFGDVRKINFDDWWFNRGFKLAFQHAVPFDLDECTPAEFKVLKASGDYLLVAVPIDQTLPQKKKLMEKLEEKATFKRATREKIYGSYSVHSRPDEILEKWLMVWDSKKSEPGATLLDIAKQLDIKPQEGSRHDDKARLKLVSRNLITAKRVIDHAAEGRFAEY